MTVAAATRLGRAWLGTVGRAALARAVPAWAGATVVVGVLFGGNGLRPADLATIARGAPAVIAVVAAGWLILLAPAAAATRTAPGASYLATLPGARVWRWLAPATIALLIHAPFAALALAASPTRGAALWLGLAATSVALAAGIARLPSTSSTPRWRGPIAALTGAHLRAIVRRRGGSLAFAGGLALLGGALAAAMIDDEPWTPALASLPAAVTAAVTAVALAAIASAVVEDRAALTAWTAATATPPTTAALAATSIITGAGLAVALAMSVVVLVLARPAPEAGATIVAAALTTGLGVGLAMTGAAERFRHDRKPAQAIAAAAGAVAMAAVIAIGLWAWRGVGAVVGLGAAAALARSRR